MRLLIIWVLLTKVDTISPADSTTLRLVQILFRHGDRSPTHVYPTDPHQEDSWPQGLGQLSKVGMQQMYEVGQFIRTRYVGSGFLTANYTNTEIYIRSTDVDRTLMSAYCVLTGFYPPEGKQVWNGTLPWQPIPVHTVPRAKDNLLYLHCPTYEKAYEKLMQSPNMLQLQDQHKNLIDYVSQHSGLSATLDSLLHIMDPLLCEKINKKPFPPWLIVNNTAENILKLIDLKVQVRTNTPEMNRIRGGPLLGRMIQNMKDQISNKLSRKALLFSAHDSTIEAFLSALNVFNDLYVPYGSSVYVELHVVKDAPVVKVFYRNDTTAEPYLLKLSGCSDPCPLAELERLTQHMIPEDANAMCNGDSHTAHGGHLSGATVAVAVLIPVILAVFLAILAVRFMQERKRQALYRYRPVNDHL